jgi:hypothetical protein
MIKRAAGAGAVAWTAPIIIDSLASPAAAATNGPCTLSVFQLNRTSSSTCALVSHTACTAGTTGTCRNYNGTAAAPLPGACSGQSVTFTVSGTCQIVATAVVNTSTNEPNTVPCPASTTLTDITPTQSVTLTAGVGNGKAALFFLAVNGC